MNAARDFLTEFKSIRNFAEIVPVLVKDEELRTSIFAEIESEEYPFPEYASWIAVHFFDKHPNLMTQNQFDSMISVLLKTSNHSVQRNLTNALVNAPFDCSENGEVLDLLIDFLHQSEALPALKYHALRMIEKHFLPAYPELMRELKTLFEVISNHPKKSMQSMARNFDKKYRKHPFYN
ncbi:hypothetical protein [Fluviicola taffensis]|uniref:Uncharacterized protein n=1 Tax=Fluviicola taffensis (strain DSM 16823 / NCIMB 13979 / RW262) TaxID=755732 RepID=F2IH65_FLUTR|nr:hypothetical protein [Fluviicola taffensis]AEA45879.1 hypothetical protein Fluta_3915 [Fluviicola taffensis DSM 16823]